MATMNDYVSQVRKMLDKFSLAQKVSLATVALVLIIGFVVVLSWASKPKYSVLFSNLEAKDAARIVDDLKTSKIPYKVEANGSVILVPDNVVYEQRMKFASLGIPQEGVVGYEIFDQTKLGMTDFVQKLNYHRALEGELARTLTSIDEIQQARVHIVIPKPALFEEDKKPTTASVVLKLKGRAYLNREQIQGITNLVASSIEGLQPENITIVDSKGNILSSEIGKDKGIGLSASQYEIRRQVEKYLEDKAQSMLMGVLGPDHSLVRVTADLNFNQIEKTIQTFDPAGSVVRSEEVSSKTSSSGSQTPQASTSNQQENSESTVTNYEISNSLEHVVNSMGNIERLSVSVLVDGTYKVAKDEKGVETKEYVERPVEELEKFTTIVKNAIGYSSTRGDQISVSSMPFEAAKEEELEAGFAQAAKYEFLQSLIQKVVLVLIAGALLYMVRILIKRSKKMMEELKVPKPIPVAPLFAPPPNMAPEAVRARALEEVGRLEEEISMEGIKKAEMQKKLIDFVHQRPDQATQLVRTWIYEEQGR